MIEKAYIGLGSNIGDRSGNLKSAYERLSEDVGIICTSHIYESDPVDYEDQPKFLNCVILIETDKEPLELLDLLSKIEDDMGRERVERFGPRNIDLDILLYGDEILDDTRLQIPHPRMAKRAFVLKPLCDIDQNGIHPTTGKSFQELLADIDASGLDDLGPLLI